MDAFTEDWNASQFWYTDAIATTLAKNLLRGCNGETRIAVVSAPSVFLQLKNLLANSQISSSGEESFSKPAQIILLEFDRRFSVFPEFHFYDFNAPTKLPVELKGKFDRIIADPPFLSEECQTKTALTVRWLAKSWDPPSDRLQSAPSVQVTSPFHGVHQPRPANPPEPVEKGEEQGFKLIACTGERMESLIHKLYSKAGIRTTSFEVVHAKGLSNEFRCYANFAYQDWKLLEEKDGVEDTNGEKLAPVDVVREGEKGGDEVVKETNATKAVDKLKELHLEDDDDDGDEDEEDFYRLANVGCACCRGE